MLISKGSKADSPSLTWSKSMAIILDYQPFSYCAVILQT